MIQFYAPEIETLPVLPPEESVHCCRVLRMKEGDVIRVTDGKGNLFECELADANPKGCLLKVIRKESVPKYWDFDLTIAVAPTKNIDRIEWFVEKSVEIGVDRIILLQCEHSERKHIRIDRIRKIAVSAMNQSLKVRLPEVTELIRFDAALTMKKGEGYLAYCNEKYERKEFCQNYKGNHDVTIFVGPEGDFSPEEADKAVSAGFIPVTFGKCRLRTETAALFGVQAAHIISELNS